MESINKKEDTKMSSIVCDDCGTVVEVHSDNYYWINSNKSIICGFCSSRGKIEFLTIMYRNKWMTPAYFLFQDNKNEIEKVRRKRDVITLYLLNSLAQNEDDRFKSAKPSFSKLLWKEGEIIGYYMASDHLGIPALRQIFVRKWHRGDGYGTLMLYDFLAEHRKVFIEKSNASMDNLLLKNRLISIEDNKMISDRIRFC